MFKRIFGAGKPLSSVMLLCLCLTLIFQISAPFSVRAEDGEPLSVRSGGNETESSSVEYYGRAALATLANAEKLLFAYDAIVDGVESSKSEIVIYNGKDKISADEMTLVYDAYTRDHTEHFWLGNSYTYSHVAGAVTKMHPSYIMQGAALEAAKIEFEAATDAILAGLAEGATEYEREVFLHDLLATKVSYVSDAPNAHNAYGALVEGRAVCEGYAEALQYLLRRAGIVSFLMIGDSVDPKGGETVPHAWNAVKIDGKFYQVDLTWNDQETYLYHAYFNLTDAEISKDHAIEESSYPLPVCNSDEKNYFTVNSERRLGAFSVDAIAALMKKGGKKTSVYTSNPEDTIAEFRENISAIASRLEVIGKYSYGYAAVGGEVLLYINSCDHVFLTRVPGVTPTCTENGNEEYYVCNFCGNLFSDSKGKNMIFTSPTVVSGGHDWSVKIADAEHLRSEPKNCSEHDTYWLVCSECGVTSDILYFNGEKTGEHSEGEGWAFDMTKHWHPCENCDEMHYGEETHTFDGMKCSICGYTMLGELGDVIDAIGAGVDGSNIVTGAFVVGGVLVLMTVVCIILRRRHY